MARTCCNDCSMQPRRTFQSICDRGGGCGGQRPSAAAGGRLSEGSQAPQAGNHAARGRCRVAGGFVDPSLSGTGPRWRFEGV